MPTTLPLRRPRTRSGFDLFFWTFVATAFALSFFVIEIVDPAPMDVAAEIAAAP